MSDPVIESMAESVCLRHRAEQAEDAWLNTLADEAESEGTEGSVSIEDMYVMLAAPRAVTAAAKPPSRGRARDSSP